MNLLVLELYNAFLKMSIKVFRTPQKTYIYSKQLTPVRNQYKDTEYANLDEIKGDILGEIINGYVITQNMLGIDFIDNLLEPVNNAIKENKLLGTIDENDGQEETKKSIEI
jgi:hypothetical protein